ncbi:MAG: 50S ribosomal protein L9 [Rhodospirillaceae bacterium]|nr:50S ribosomal protein L9 [Rhodospirillaceae bacterium]|tara:strand:+ start:185 stop:721 length:537 start_codon:yes stop_codon:yes gene_type:complete
MNIILLEKIDNVGDIGDEVRVKPGYARNYLIPQGKATVATPENISKFESMRADLEAKAAGELEKAQSRAENIEGKIVSITANAGPEGKLFGSVGTIDIAEACNALGLGIERSEIRLPEGPIRIAGEHQIELHLHTDINVSLTVAVEGEYMDAPVDLLDSEETNEVTSEENDLAKENPE